jgi:3-deoxy-D-manno-octulosonate 8-phosphate phosphatase KdsC-like HAD superfamily phosphatase
MSSMSGPLTCVLVLVGVGLHFAPENVVARVRAVIADSLRPGQVAAREVTEFVRGHELDED